MKVSIFIGINQTF